MSEEIEVVVFNDKSWVRLSDYMELKSEHRKIKNRLEKMKNCHNCKNASFSYGDNHCKLLLTLRCRSYDKWEIRT